MTDQPVHDDIIYGRSALRNGEPWIVPASLDHIRSIVDTQWHVFEWGSGGSTVYWARHCAHVISIEHNSEWIPRTCGKLARERLDNAAVFHVPRGPGDTFDDYADVILDYPDDHFDLVFVDGEASCRGRCLNNALAKVKVGGTLLLDNSNWLKREIPDYERVDYKLSDLRWIGEPEPFDWWTSVLTRLR